MTLQHLRSSTANKRPTPAAMSDGQLAMNTNLASPGLFLKDSNGDLVKVGPVHVGTTAPNATPAVGGQAGNSKGEQWLDTTGGVYVFKIYDGTAWRSETGTFVDVNGDTMTGALGIIAGSAAAPGVFFSGDLNTGIYSPGADQVAVATNGTGRLFIDSSGQIGIGTSSPGNLLHVESSFSGTLAKIKNNAGSTSADTALEIESSTTAAKTFLIKNSGTERFYVKGDGTSYFNGLVGIGTTSPGQSLSIVSPSTAQAIGIWNRASDNIYSGIYFKTSDGAIDQSSILNERAGTNGASLLFYTKADGGSTTERARIDSSGRLLVGTSTARSIGGASFWAQYTEGTNTYWGASVIISNTNDNFGPVIAFGKSRGTAVGSNTVVVNGDTLGDIRFCGADGSTLNSFGAQIKGEVDGTPGANDMPGRLVFSTTADGASATTERMRITSAGLVGIGTTSPGSTLHVVGNQFLTGGNYFTDTTSGYFFNGSGGFAGGIFGSNSGNTANIVSPQTIALSTASTERARIDSSGRLLVGTSTAGTAKVSIQGATGNSTYTVEGLSVAVGGDTVNPNGRGVVADFGAGGVADSAATYGATINLGASSVGQWGVRILPGGSFAISDYYPGGAYVGAANPPTARMSIDTNGRIGINIAPNVQRFLVGHNSEDGVAISDTNASSVQANLLLSHIRAGGTSNYYILAYANSVNTFIVYSNGNVQNTNNSYGAISDIKLKENIVDANSQWSDLKSLQVRNYNLKEGQTHTQIGLVAQEAELVSPGLVSESPDRDADGNDLGTVTKSVNYSVLYMKAVKALQEAMERIETLEARLTAAGIE